jgi:hypothetical protein
VHDQIVHEDHGHGGLVCVVEALAADLAVQPRDLGGCFPAAVAAAFLAGDVPLGRREPSGGRGEIARAGGVPNLAWSPALAGTLVGPSQGTGSPAAWVTNASRLSQPCFPVFLPGDGRPYEGLRPRGRYVRADKSWHAPLLHR